MISTGSLAQLVEQLAFNQLVIGSNPIRPTRFRKRSALVLLFRFRCLLQILLLYYHRAVIQLWCDYGIIGLRPEGLPSGVSIQPL